MKEKLLILCLFSFCNYAGCTTTAYNCARLIFDYKRERFAWHHYGAIERADGITKRPSRYRHNKGSYTLRCLENQRTNGERYTAKPDTYYTTINKQHGRWQLCCNGLFR